MGLDRTRWPELLVGLERVGVLEVARGGDGRLYVVIETTDRLVGCRGCGCRARVKDRDRVSLVDLPVFDDLAVGAPGESVGSVVAAGAVNVIYGSSTGLTGTGSQLFTQDTTGVGSTAEAFDNFGGRSPPATSTRPEAHRLNRRI